MKKYLKNQSGITLLVLIITVIVLLILAATTISTIVKTGMVEKAKNTAKLAQKDPKNLDLEIDKLREELKGQDLQVAIRFVDADNPSVILVNDCTMKIYRDKNCKQSYKEITLDTPSVDSNYSYILENKIPVGVYYATFDKAPAGYNLNPGVFEVRVISKLTIVTVELHQGSQLPSTGGFLSIGEDATTITFNALEAMYNGNVQAKIYKIADLDNNIKNAQGIPYSYEYINTYRNLGFEQIYHPCKFRSSMTAQEWSEYVASFFPLVEYIEDNSSITPILEFNQQGSIKINSNDLDNNSANIIIFDPIYIDGTEYSVGYAVIFRNDIYESSINMDGEYGTIQTLKFPILVGGQDINQMYNEVEIVSNIENYYSSEELIVFAYNVTEEDKYGNVISSNVVTTTVENGNKVGTVTVSAAVSSNIKVSLAYTSASFQLISTPEMNLSVNGTDNQSVLFSYRNLDGANAKVGGVTIVNFYSEDDSMQFNSETNDCNGIAMLHEFSDWTNHVSIASNPDNDDGYYIRVKAVSPANPIVSDPFGKWTDGDDGYYYYSDIILPGEATEVIDIRTEYYDQWGDYQDFNVAIVAEYTPVLYNIYGAPYAGWNDYNSSSNDAGI